MTAYSCRYPLSDAAVAVARAAGLDVQPPRPGEGWAVSCSGHRTAVPITLPTSVGEWTVRATIAELRAYGLALRDDWTVDLAAERAHGGAIGRVP